MYKIDLDKNQIEPIEMKRFSELGVSERYHLQEWLVSYPNALGEDLLIIQKEFSGFDDTRERLDLLAIDKNGQLVIIENKLDDSGRDVVWQSVKYASYCSSLTKGQIIAIYQQYLARYCGGGNAEDLLCEFLELEDLGEAVFNTGNKQRIMLVAANFRLEVTSTVLWLLSHGIDVKCFKVSPYQLNSELLLSIEQIIPTPEAEEYRIRMSAKEEEESSTQVSLKEKQVVHLAYWSEALEAFKASACTLFNNKSPSKDNWLYAASGIANVNYGLILGRSNIRVELSFMRPTKEENKFLFDYMFAQKEKVEHTFGAPLSWYRKDEIKASRIKFEKPMDSMEEEVWPQMIDWMIEHMIRLEQSFSKPLEDAARALKDASFED